MVPRVGGYLANCAAGAGALSTMGCDCYDLEVAGRGLALIAPECEGVLG